MNLLILNYLLHADIMWYIQLPYDTVAASANIQCCVNCCFLSVIILRVPQKKKSSSLEDLQSESLEKVGFFVIAISGV